MVWIDNSSEGLCYLACYTTVVYYGTRILIVFLSYIYSNDFFSGRHWRFSRQSPTRWSWRPLSRLSETFMGSSSTSYPCWRTAGRLATVQGDLTFKNWNIEIPDTYSSTDSSKYQTPSRQPNHFTLLSFQFVVWSVCVLRVLCFWAPRYVLPSMALLFYHTFYRSDTLRPLAVTVANCYLVFLFIHIYSSSMMRWTVIRIAWWFVIVGGGRETFGFLGGRRPCVRSSNRFCLSNRRRRR